MGRIWKIGAKSVTIVKIQLTTWIFVIISLVPKRIGPRDTKQNQVFSQICFGVSNSPTKKEQLLICSTPCYGTVWSFFYNKKTSRVLTARRRETAYPTSAIFFKFPDTLHMDCNSVIQHLPLLFLISAHMLQQSSKVPDRTCP